MFEKFEFKPQRSYSAIFYDYILYIITAILSLNMYL